MYKCFLRNTATAKGVIIFENLNPDLIEFPSLYELNTSIQYVKKLQYYNLIIDVSTALKL